MRIICAQLDNMLLLLLFPNQIYVDKAFLMGERVSLRLLSYEEAECQIETVSHITGRLIIKIWKNI